MSALRRIIERRASRRDSSLSTESPPTNVEEGVEGGDPVETVVSPTAAARLAASGRSVSFVESPLDAQVVDSPVEEPLVETVVPSQSSLDDVSKVQPLADPPASSALRKDATPPHRRSSSSGLASTEEDGSSPDRRRSTGSWGSGAVDVSEEEEDSRAVVEEKSRSPASFGSAPSEDQESPPSAFVSGRRPSRDMTHRVGPSGPRSKSSPDGNYTLKSGNTLSNLFASPDGQPRQRQQQSPSDGNYTLQSGNTLSNLLYREDESMDAAQRRAKAVNDGNYTLQSGKTLSNLYGEEETSSVDSGSVSDARRRSSAGSTKSEEGSYTLRSGNTLSNLFADQNTSSTSWSNVSLHSRDSSMSGGVVDGDEGVEEDPVYHLRTGKTMNNLFSEEGMAQPRDEDEGMEEDPVYHLRTGKTMNYLFSEDGAPVAQPQDEDEGIEEDPVYHLRTGKTMNNLFAEEEETEDEVYCLRSGRTLPNLFRVDSQTDVNPGLRRANDAELSAERRKMLMSGHTLPRLFAEPRVPNQGYELQSGKTMMNLFRSPLKPHTNVLVEPNPYANVPPAPVLPISPKFKEYVPQNAGNAPPLQSGKTLGNLFKPVEREVAAVLSDSDSDSEEEEEAAPEVSAEIMEMLAHAGLQVDEVNGTCSIPRLQLKSLQDPTLAKKLQDERSHVQELEETLSKVAEWCRDRRFRELADLLQPWDMQGPNGSAPPLEVQLSSCRNLNTLDVQVEEAAVAQSSAPAPATSASGASKSRAGKRAKTAAPVNASRSAYKDPSQNVRLRTSTRTSTTIPFVERYPGFEFVPGDHVALSYKKQNGRVAYVGTTHFASGLWLGVELEAQVGKNDGSVEGERYFRCRPEYGVFVRPEAVLRCKRPEIDKVTGQVLPHARLPEPTNASSPRTPVRMLSPERTRRTPRSGMRELFVPEDGASSPSSSSRKRIQRPLVPQASETSQTWRVFYFSHEGNILDWLIRELPVEIGIVYGMPYRQDALARLCKEAVQNGDAVSANAVPNCLLFIAIQEAQQAVSLDGNCAEKVVDLKVIGNEKILRDWAKNAEINREEKKTFRMTSLESSFSLGSQSTEEGWNAAQQVEQEQEQQLEEAPVVDVSPEAASVEVEVSS